MPRFSLLLCLILLVPSLRPRGQEGSVSVPILMYHYIKELPAGADDMQAMLTLAPKTFHQHLEYLDKAAYQTISLYDLEDALRNGTALPEKPIILSFDDGYREHYDFVFPLLQRYEMTATFFIVSNWLGDGNFMTWEQLSQMAEAGMSIEAHTMSHPDLRNQDEDFLRDEILGNVELIESHLGIRPRFFAYPYGGYDAATLAFLAGTDILGAVSIQSGSLQRLDKIYELRRLMVTNETDVEGLRILLSRS
jgi:peptidoglycan/xylan/chitin deacetylase (PgdA/CDA1 family)